MSNPSITADKTPWYQWDTGLTVTVSGGEMTECHFANRKQGTAYVQAVINGIARVPDELLQVAAQVKAYGYVSDGAGGQTYIEDTFDVIARNIPSDYTYTKTAQKTIRDAEAARDEAVQAAKDAKASELAADDSAVEASNSAQSAGESASAAATSASNAAKSAGDAAKSASDAKAAADKAVEDASELLKTYTDNAKTSADNAATSASNAADAASAASGSASEAAQSATDASNAKAAAQTAKDEAATSASNAATSASNAESSATAAAQSASDAAASVNAINVIAPKNVPTGANVGGSGYSSVAIGNSAECKSGSSYAVAVGQSAVAKKIGSIMIGSGATELDDSKGRNVCIGDATKINGKVENSVAIGSGSIANKQLEFSIGNNERLREITHVSAPTADTSASTKKYTDDNDAKTFTEAKKYTDANTSNALVGNVSGKLLHVEDAWPSPVREFVVYGKSVQDGTPAPDAPMPIESVSELSVVSARKNLISARHSDWAEPSGTVSIDGETITVKSSIAYGYASLNFGKKLNGRTVYIGYESVSGVNMHSHMQFIVIKEDGTAEYLSYTNSPVTIPDYAKECSFAIYSNNSRQVIDSEAKFVRPFISFDNNGFGSFGDKMPATTSNLLVSEDGTAYELRSLPDGTMDELVVRDGRRVLHMMTDRTSTAVADGVTGTVGTDVISSTGEIADGADVVFKLSNPLTIDIGKADPIMLPETVSNVWINDNLTPEMSMTYKRDINVAFDNLVQAVVASAAGE